ncbi:MAG: hypothetical protein WC359_12405 [Dehalococcoidia bacterium]|jgi:hypothetical protein
MPGIEFEREMVSFDVSERVAQVLNSIKDGRVKNYLLNYCGKELEAANKAASRCYIKDTVETIEMVGNVLSSAEDSDYIQAVKSHLKTGENLDKIFEDLDRAFVEDMTSMLTGQCGCKG